MPRFAASLSMLFAEPPSPERLAAARETGFEGVEFQFPHDRPIEVMAGIAPVTLDGQGYPPDQLGHDGRVGWLEPLLS